ncbi:MAG: ISL3 family transposase [Anaerolineae bacterium]|nr:ISL3 family transposase [Anaerolineae bacterium]
MDKVQLSRAATCPLCKHKSDRIHSYYQRTLKDLPMADHTVQLHLTVQRFRCFNPTCSRKTFVESLGSLALKHAQRTQRFTSAGTALGMALGGEAGQRAADKLHLPASPDTLLRMIRQVPLAAEGKSFRVVGIDDWAFRRSTSYGTLIVDLEQHRPIELLSDRTAETVAAWLKQHPDIEFVTRDRSTEYIRGIALGAPQAQQVADRWHLLKNMTELLERLLANLRSELSRFLAQFSNPQEPVVRRIEKRSKNERNLRAARRAKRIARYEQVRALYARGVKIKRIAQQLQMSRMTVRQFAKAETYPEMAPHSRIGALTPFEPYLRQRWKEGCRNALQLYREVCARGYRAKTHHQVAKWVGLRREEPKRYSHLSKRIAESLAPLPTTANPTSVSQVTVPSAKRLAWLLVKDPEQLDEKENTLLGQLLQHPAVAKCYALGQQFTKMVRYQLPKKLTGWLKACQDSGIPEFASFADGINSDRSAIRAALTLAWSNGQLEGQVNRLKLIKRQMYGRANFDLLRIRVLSET